jgi:uncharacterized repeat protein (TIGR01451 family)
MRFAAKYYRTAQLAAVCCVAFCSCRLTDPVSQSTRAPIVLAEEREPIHITIGAPRFAPPSAGSTTVSDDSQQSNQENSPASYTVVTDAVPQGATSQDDAPPNTASAAVYVSDANCAPAAGVSLDNGVTYSPNQRDAGPANRWSVYGVDPRYNNLPLPPGEGRGEGAGSCFATLPPEAYTGYPGDHYTQPGYVPQYMLGPPANSLSLWERAGVRVSDDGGITDPSVHESTQRVDNMACGQEPLSTHSCGPWKPPGISGPWPEDEYLFDGGDSDGQVKVRPDGRTLEGLDSEDTIAHYDTLDGRTVVKPSCRVCIYAPRFVCVRQVLLPYGDNQLVKAGGVDMPIGPVPQLDIQPVASSMQPITPVGEIGARGPITFLEHTPPIGLISHTVIRATIDRLKPYENYSIIRTGEIIEAEMAYVAESAQAAIVWTTAQGVDVMIGGKKAVAIEGDQRAQATYSIEPPNHPCLRICKVASAHSAKPGETVEFTLRFDNVGDQPVGNVTIVDNLTTRLELVEGSGQCSKDAKFFTESNKEGSLILHWEITNPINPGDGGIARFKCIVR